MKSVQTEMKEEIIRISASQETLKEVVQERLLTVEIRMDFFTGENNFNSTLMINNSA